MATNAFSFIPKSGIRVPKRDEAPFQSYGDVVAAITARNANTLNPPKLTTSQGLTMGGSPAAAPRGNLTSYRSVRNPALEAILNQGLADYNDAGAANRTALTDYTKAINAGSEARQLQTDQEVASIDPIFNGGASADLARMRAEAASRASGANAASGTALDAIRARLGLSVGGGIDTLQQQLAKQRGEYEARTAGEIGGEEAALLGLRSSFAKAQRNATNQAIRDASAERLATAAAQGLGSSSYFNRLGIGQRQRAETDLATRLSDRELADYGRVRSQRAGLTDRLGALERGEITDAGNSRIGLAGRLGDQERADYLKTLAEDQRINDYLAQQERGDYGDVLNRQAANRGVRGQLRNANAQNFLLPIQARQGVLSDAIRNASGLAALDEATALYEIDDGGRFTPRQQRTPYRPNSFTPPEYSVDERGGVINTQPPARRTPNFQMPFIGPMNRPVMSQPDIGSRNFVRGYAGDQFNVAGGGRGSAAQLLAELGYDVPQGLGDANMQAQADYLNQLVGNAEVDSSLYE